MDEIIKRLPVHKCELTITHNAHRNVYDSLDVWIRENDWCDWENEEAKARAIATDECWTISWYPDTPVGFYAVAAPTLNEALRLSQDGEG